MPNIGDKAIIKHPHSTSYCTWIKCPKCGKERWVQNGHKKHPNFKGLCSICNHHKPHSPERHPRGKDHPSWKGGRTKHNGYVRVVLYPDDFFYQMADNTWHRVAEHRFVMAKHLGRNLHPWEIVHHKNGIRDDNRIENLQLVSDDRHNQITILKRRIACLEAENKKLKSLNHPCRAN